VKFLNPERKSCGFKNIRIRVNGAVVNINAPNKDKIMCKCIKNLHKTLQTENLDCEENLLCGGVFDCPLNPTLDKKGGVKWYLEKW